RFRRNNTKLPCHSQMHQQSGFIVQDDDDPLAPALKAHHGATAQGRAPFRNPGSAETLAAAAQVRQDTSDEEGTQGSYDRLDFWQLRHAEPFLSRGCLSRMSPSGL